VNYIAPLDLLTRFGAEELAQVADRGTPRLVTPELLASAIGGADLATWASADADAVGAALATIDTAIVDAESAVDGYLSGRYATPMPTPPAAVKRMAADIARYYLYDDHATETVQKRYDAAIAYFRDVSNGKVSLGPEAQAGTPVSGGGSVEFVTSGKVFGRAERGL